MRKWELWTQTIQDCLTTQKIEEMSKNGMGEVEVASAVSSSFGAGTEMVSFSGLLVAMLHFPHVMRKAQAKLDNVVGPDNPEKSLPDTIGAHGRYVIRGVMHTMFPDPDDFCPEHSFDTTLSL
ncbi:hypothetical protein EV424DRAFT_1340550 [Suillus variegatus]|nr:hypothetical protein EV424DRAFT_1340550 [Suillus variegatus]